MDSEITIYENDLDWVFQYLVELYMEEKLSHDDFANLVWSL